jgi:hypothetical protein
VGAATTTGGAIVDDDDDIDTDEHRRSTSLRSTQTPSLGRRDHARLQPQCTFAAASLCFRRHSLFSLHKPHSSSMASLSWLR